MIIFRRQQTVLVMEDATADGDSTWRAVRLNGDRTLSILGQDTGPSVADLLGGREYEFARELSKQETQALRRSMGVPRRGDLLAAIGERFTSTHELEAFAADQGITGDFWSRVSH